MCRYIYIENKEKFEEQHPYDKKDIENYPSNYPCVICVEYQSGGITGDYYSVNIIENIRDFILLNGFLYKKC